MWIQAIREAISLGQEFLCQGEPGCEAVSAGVWCAFAFFAAFELRSWRHIEKPSCFASGEIIQHVWSGRGDRSFVEDAWVFSPLM